jgi:hypothetical protein
MSEAAVPDVGLLIDDLAIAYQKSFGASRIGARERLNAAHLVDTLNNFDAEPERIRGALRAALAKTKAEADLFDLVYPDAGRRQESSADPAPLPQPEPAVLETQPTEQPSRKWLFIGLGIVAAVVIAAMASPLLTREIEKLSPDAIEVDPSLLAAGNIREPSGVAATPATDSAVNSSTIAGRVDDSKTAAYAEEISAILDRASEFGYRASPRELANAFASSFDMAEADLTRDIARNAGQAPDLPLDLFDVSVLGGVHAALHGPVTQDVRDEILSSAILDRAARQTEYVNFEDGGLVLHWRDGDEWRAQPLDGEPIQDELRQLLVSPDGSRAIMRGLRTSVLWDLVGLKELARAETPGATAQVSIPPEPRAAFIPGSSDGLVYGGNGVVHLAPDGAAPPQGLPANMSQFVASASGTGFAIVDDDGMINIWDAATQTSPRGFRTTQPFDKLVLSDNLGLLLGAVDAEIQVWDTNGTLLRTLPASMEYGDAFFVANDTRILLNHLGGVELYDVATGEVVSRFESVFDAGAQVVQSAQPAQAVQSAQARRSADGSLVLIAWVGEGEQEQFATANAVDGQLVAKEGMGSNLTAFGTPGDASGLLALTAPVDANLEPSDTEKSMIYVSTSATAMESVGVELTLPASAVHYLNIPSIAEATTRAAAFAETRKPKPLPDWPMWLAVAIPLLIAAVLLARPASWRKAYLSRRKIESDTLIRKLTANVTTFEPLAGERRAVGRLDQRLRQPSHRLDLRETVIATARAGGMFTPVADTDAGTPEYVALIERRRLTDADAARMVAFFNRLRSAGLSLTLYTYSGTPEALTPLRGGHAIPIETLRQRHAGAFLLITGDSARFHNRKTGGVATWTSRLGPVRRPGQGRSFAPTWSGGAFLSREPMPRLGPAERAIERDLGLVVRHTDAGDLTAIGDYFHGRSASLAPHDEDGRKPVPAYFANSPERLVEEEPPGVIERQDLAPQLEAWLGAEGLRWVRALAYYPIVQWDLALYLASILMPHMSAEARAAMEAKVARLPWLEHGFMPDWVRQTLVEGADPKEEKRIVREIVAVMAEAREGVDGNISFQLMDPASGATSEHTGDAIFIDAVARAKARPWDLPPPSQWLRRAPEALQMPWARMRIALAAIVLAAAAAIFTPHSGNTAPLAQWTPVLLFGLLAIAMAVGPALITRYADRGRG